MALTRGADVLIEIGAEALADPVYETMFPAQIPSRVRIRTKDGELLKEVIDPLGEPANPMDGARLLQKFSGVAQGRLAAPHRRAFLAAFDALRGGRPAPLIEALQHQLLVARPPVLAPIAVVTQDAAL